MNLLTINLNKKESLYLQLYNTIKNGIINGDIAPGEKLPSKRLLHEHLGISLNTIMQAYNLLIEEGFVNSEPQKGYYVLNYSMPKRNIKSIDSTTIISNKVLYDFTTKSIDKTLFPYFTWSKITKSVLFEENLITSKTSGKGSTTLRGAIAKYLYETKGIVVNTNNIVIGSGIEYLLTLLISLIDTDTYVLEDPGYDKISKILINNNKNIIYSPIDSEGLTLNNLKSAGCVYVTPANQFPTGIKMSLQRKLELIKWANNKYIIEDDFDSEFKYLSNTSTSLYALNPDRCILLSTFSRTIAPSLRISYMILPDALMEKYEEKFSFYSSTVSTIDQMTLAKFISSGSYSRHLNKTKSIYKQKRLKILELIKDIDCIHPDIENSYLSLIIDVDNLNKEKFKSLAKKALIDISLMDDFSKTYKSNKIIIGYSSIPLSDIENGIKALIDILEKAK